MNTLEKPDTFERLVIYCILVFGLWQFISTLSVFIGLTFSQLKIAAIFYFLLLIGAFYLFSRSSTVILTSEKTARRYLPFHTKWEIKLLAAIGILILYWLSNNFVLFWILSIALLLWTFIDIEIGGKAGSKHPIMPGSAAHWIVAALAVAMAIIALCIKTQDADVAFTLNVIVSALDHPDRVLLSFDGMHGDNNIPMLSPIYLIQSYELFVALLSSLSGVNEADLFYLVFPAFFAAFIIIANWIVLRLFSGDIAIVGVIVIFVLLASWGTGYHAYGSYSLNYIFLSKASIAVVWTPILIYLTIGFAEAPTWDKWLLLLIGQAATINMSSTGVVLAPLVVGTTLLASWRFDWPTTQTMLLGLLSTGYVLLIGLWVMIEAKATGGLELIMHGPDTDVSGGTTDGLNHLLGNGPRHYLAFLGLFACAILPGMRSSMRWRSGLVLVAFIFIINPWTPEFLAEHIAWNLYWRAFWAVPFPFFIGLAAASYMATSPKLNSIQSGTVVIAAFLFIFSVSGKMVLYKHRLGKPSHKVGWNYYEADFIAGRTTPDDLVLAPEKVAQWLPTFHHSPQLLVSRQHYLLHWQSKVFPPHEIKTRHNLLNFVSGIESPNFSTPEAMKEILNRNINVILFSKNLKWGTPFAEKLREAGFMVTEVRDYLLWEKHA